jgi:hypothetical protein
MLEDVFQALDIPTRSEIDDAYKIIHDLKREVRALKKALNPAGSKAVAKPAKSTPRGGAARAQVK